MGEWISVEERLPPSEGYWKAKRYLIYADSVHILAYYLDEKWVSDCDGFYHTYNPTHWMPLPVFPRL